MPVELWPSRSLTTRIGTPAARARLALVWRNPWKRITGRPARRASAWNRRVTYSGRGIRPFSYVNTSPASCQSLP